MFCEVDNWEQLYKLFKKKNIGAGDDAMLRNGWCGEQWGGTTEKVDSSYLSFGYTGDDWKIRFDIIGYPQKKTREEIASDFFSICFWKNIQQEVI